MVTGAVVRSGHQTAVTATGVTGPCVFAVTRGCFIVASIAIRGAVTVGDRILRYARVTQGMTAGTVAVDVVGSSEHSTRVQVTYDLTALTSAGESWLEMFDADYDTAIGGWSTEIAAGLRRP